MVRKGMESNGYGFDLNKSPRKLCLLNCWEHLCVCVGWGPKLSLCRQSPRLNALILFLSILIKCNFYEKKNAHTFLKTGCVISKPKSRHDRSGGQTWDWTCLMFPKRRTVKGPIIDALDPRGHNSCQISRRRELPATHWREYRLISPV